jgi:hypothetical protein
MSLAHAAGGVLRADWRDPRHVGLRACVACVRAAAALLGSRPLACLLCGDVAMALALAFTLLCDLPLRHSCGPSAVPLTDSRLAAYPYAVGAEEGGFLRHAEK